MKIESLFNQTANAPTLTNTLANALQSFGLLLMCCRIGIVQAFYPDDLTADVLIINQKLEGLNADGSQVTREWAPIRAKVCYCSPYDTFPINKGDECILLFSDREIESWFINGNTNPVKHSRMHDETDCIAIFGLRSLPKMVQILLDARHIFYGSSDIQLKNTEIISNTSDLTVNAQASAEINTAVYTLNASDTIEQNTKEYSLKAETSAEIETEEYKISADASYTLETQTADITSNTLNITAPQISITGNITQTGSLTASSLADTSAATGIFRSQDNKTITVTNGIITAIV